MPLHISKSGFSNKFSSGDIKTFLKKSVNAFAEASELIRITAINVTDNAINPFFILKLRKTHLKTLRKFLGERETKKKHLNRQICIQLYIKMYNNIK